MKTSKVKFNPILMDKKMRERNAFFYVKPTDAFYNGDFNGISLEHNLISKYRRERCEMKS